MTIRKATRTDVPAIVSMLAEDNLGQQRENYQEPLPTAYYDAFEKIDADSKHELVVMEQDGAVVGTLQLSFLQYLTYRGGIRAQIEAVRVHKDLRGQGLGEQLIRWAIDRAGKRGAHVMQLTSDKQRAGALRFYERLGFRPTHEGMKLKISTAVHPLPS